MLSNAVKTNVIKGTQDRELEAVGHCCGNGRPKCELPVTGKGRIVPDTIMVWENQHSAHRLYLFIYWSLSFNCFTQI